MWFLYILIGLTIGALLVYFIQKPKMKTFVELDTKTAQENKALQVELAGLQIELAELNTRKSEILNSMSDLEKQAQEAGQKLLAQNIELANSNFEHQAEALANKFQEHTETAQTEYLNTIKEMSEEVAAQLQGYQEELVLLEHAIADKQAIVTAAVAANKRAVKMEAEQNFYKLNLTEDDLKEIARLREVLPYLRDSEPLNKVIWKVYYEKPYTDLVGRVIGPGAHTGIYRITNTKNNMCYVGQAANLAERWRQHIKRGVGAEAPTKNKLYPAMMSFGVENFTFEVIEECDRADLDTREDYWQDYFHAKDFGYSIK